MPVETYGLWTNKGGVGKTTLTYHLSTLYAHLHRDKRVIIIDMCPQANLSSTVLTYSEMEGEGSERVRINHGSEVVAKLSAAEPLPKTVAGFFHTQLPNGMGIKPPKESYFLTKIDDINSNMPDNIWLFCGDGRLDDMNQAFSVYSTVGVNPGAIVDPYKAHMARLRSFLTELVEGDSADIAWKNKDVVAFIDTNPAFSEYTQIALCTIDRLVVPVNADDFSLQAAEYMLRKVWGLGVDENDMLSAYLDGSFAAKVRKRAPSLVPHIQAIIHNRHNIVSTKAVAVFRALHEEQASFFFKAFRQMRHEAGQANDTMRVFNSQKAEMIPMDEDMDSNRKSFEEYFTCTMRDMFSTGLASSHTGIPLHKLRTTRTLLKSSFGTGVVSKTVLVNLLEDMLNVLCIVTGDLNLSDSSVDKQRLQNLLIWKGDPHSPLPENADYRDCLEYYKKKKKQAAKKSKTNGATAPSAGEAGTSAGGAGPSANGAGPSAASSAAFADPAGPSAPPTVNKKNGKRARTAA